MRRSPPLLRRRRDPGPGKIDPVAEPEPAPIPLAVKKQIQFLVENGEAPTRERVGEDSDGDSAGVLSFQSDDLREPGAAGPESPARAPQFSKSDVRRVFKWSDSVDKAGLSAAAGAQERELLGALFAEAVADKNVIDTVALARYPLLPLHRLACALSADLFRRTTMRTQRYVQVLQPLLSELTRCLYREATAEAVADRVAQRLTPQLRCSAYFEEAQGLQRELRKRTGEKTVHDKIRAKMQDLSVKRQAFIGRKEHNWRLEMLKECFVAWRSTMIENKRKVLVAKRYFSKLYGVRPDSVLRAWRSVTQGNKLSRLANNNADTTRRIERLEYELAEAEASERDVESELVRTQADIADLKTAIHNAKKELREQREHELADTLTAVATAVRRVAPVALAAVKASLRQLLEMPNALVLVPAVLPDKELGHLSRLAAQREEQRGTHLSARAGRSRRQERRAFRAAVSEATRPKEDSSLFPPSVTRGAAAGSGEALAGNEPAAAAAAAAGSAGRDGDGVEDDEGEDAEGQAEAEAEAERRRQSRPKERGNALLLDSSDDEAPPAARAVDVSSASAVHRALAEAVPHVECMFPSFSERPQESEDGAEALADWFWGRAAYAQALPFHRLLGMTTDRILVAWVNWHVGRAMPFGERAGLYARRARNLGSDLEDGEILAVFVEQLHPGAAHGLGARARALIDPEARIDLVMKTLRLFVPGASDVVSTNLVLNKDATLLGALLARLFCTHPGLRFSPHVARAQTAVDACIRRWGSCRSAVDKALEEGALQTMPVQRMQVLASEVHECCRAFSAARIVLGEALRCARAGSRLYRHLHARMVDMQWFAFCAKMLKWQPAFTDGRRAAELRRFADIAPEDVVALLAAERERASAAAPPDAAAAGAAAAAHAPGAGPADQREQDAARRADASGEASGVPPELARAEVVQTMRLLARHADILQRVFRHYSAGGPTGGSVITAQEFRYFVRDARLRDSTLTAAAVDRIFAASAVEIADMAQSAGDGDGEEAVVGLRQRHFLTALLRLALLRYRRPPDAAPLEATLAPRLALLLRQYVVPNALKSDSERFRTMLNREEVRDVLRAHRDVLQRVFRYYADGTTSAPVTKPPAAAGAKRKEGGGGKRRGKKKTAAAPAAEQARTAPAVVPLAFNPLGTPPGAHIAPDAGLVSGGGPPASAMRLPTMSEHAFVRLLSDARALDYGMDDVAARKLFANVQQEEDGIGPDAFGGKARLVYAEFQEALAAVSFFKVPNPYIPLHSRLDSMVTAHIIPHAKQSKR